MPNYHGTTAAGKSCIKKKNQNLHLFFQDNNKCLIYFQVKYCGWNYGCHCINLGRAERQSLENLFPWTKTPADIELWRAEPMAMFIFCSRSWRQQQGWLPSPLCLPLPTGSNTMERALLKSVLRRQPVPQMRPQGQCFKKTFTLQISITSPDLEFLGERQNVCIKLHNQFTFHTHVVCPLRKEEYYFFFFTSNCIFV